MKRINRYKLTAIALLFACAMAMAQFEEEKTFDKAVAAASDVKINIQNKHGNISINSWQKDSVVVHAVISGRSKSLEKLQSAMITTEVNFKNSGDNISITTGANMSTFDRSINEIKSVAGLNDINIDYEISLPIGARLSVSNRYGDIYLDKHNGELNIELSHGNLRADELKRINYFKSNFGNIYISNIETMDGNLLFSDLEIEKCGELNVSSKSTSYEIEEIETMTIRSSNDKIDIDEIGSFTINGSLSKVTIDQLKAEMDANLNYGKVRVKKVEAEASTINLFSNRTTFDLTFDSSISFNKSGNCENCTITNGEILDSRSAGKDGKSLALRYNCQKTKLYFR